MIADQRENGELELFSECEPVIALSKRMRDEKGSWKTVITAEKVNGTISMDLGESSSEKIANRLKNCSSSSEDTQLKLDPDKKSLPRKFHR